VLLCVFQVGVVTAGEGGRVLAVARGSKLAGNSSGPGVGPQGLRGLVQAQAL